MRVADALAAIERAQDKIEPRRIIVCGRRDAALVACLAAAVSPTIDGVACEDMLLSFRTLFSAEGQAINAASILPGLLRQFGDVADIVARIAPRKVLIASGIGEYSRPAPHVRIMPGRFSAEPQRLINWLGD
jgi:hypothetical protein